MLRAVPLSIIWSFSLYTQQWYTSYRFVDSLRAGSCSQAERLVHLVGFIIITFHYARSPERQTTVFVVCRVNAVLNGRCFQQNACHHQNFGYGTNAVANDGYCKKKNAFTKDKCCLQKSEMYCVNQLAQLR